MAMEEGRGRERRAYEVCKRCYQQRTDDPELAAKACYFPTEHKTCERIRVTFVNRTWRSVRPRPVSLPQDTPWYVLCPLRGCRGQCTHAHSEVERDVWNTELSNRFPGGVSLPRNEAARSMRTASQLAAQSLRANSTPRLDSRYSSATPGKAVDVSTLRAQCRLKFEKRLANPPPREDAMVPLTRDTYKKKFHSLLFLEELEHMKVLSNRCDGKYKLFLYPEGKVPEWLQHGVIYNRYGCLLGMTGDQIQYATQSSQNVFIVRQSISGGQKVDICMADILPANFSSLEDDLYLGFRSQDSSRLMSHFPDVCNEHGVEVVAEFEVKHLYFDLLHDAVSTIPLECIDRILPKREYFKKGLDLSNVPFPKCESLYLDVKFQFKALQLAAFSRSMAPVLIPGPFGTGKTRLLAVAADYFIQAGKHNHHRTRVLVCCHHQASADTFIEKYFGCVQNSPWYVYLARVTSERYFYKGKFDEFYMTVREFKESMKGSTTCPDYDYFVVVTTFLTSLQLVDVLGQNFFTHILIDEGAQAREPESIAPFCLANAQSKIVIAGDEQQVGPQLLVFGTVPQMHGLGTSLLQRLCQDYSRLGQPDHIAKLRTNYRCHKDLLQLSSDLFYRQSKLIPAGAISLHPLHKYPLEFICSDVRTRGAGAEDTNKLEADILLTELTKLIRSGLPNTWSKRDVCIMALSRRQLSIVRKLIQRKYHDLTGVQILPSYGIQGQEFRVLCLSTVECLDPSGKSANPTKSLCNPYVFNTAITRAQSLVVATGNPFTLLTVETKMPQPKYCWKEFLKRCNDNGTLKMNCDPAVKMAIVQAITGKKVESGKSGDHGAPSNPISPPTAKKSGTLNSQANSRGGKGGTTRSDQIQSSSNASTPSAKTQQHFTSPRQPSKSLMHQKEQNPTHQPPPLAHAYRKAEQHPNRHCPPRPRHLPPPPRHPPPPPRHPPPPRCHPPPPRPHHPPLPRPPHLSPPPPTAADHRKPEKNNKQLPSPGGPKELAFMENPPSSKYLYEFKHHHRRHDEQILKAQLTRENYKEKFHQLLCREEEEHHRILSERCDGTYLFTLYPPNYEPDDTFEVVRFGEKAISSHAIKRYGNISAEHLNGDKIAYANQASAGHLFLCFPHQDTVVKAYLVEGTPCEKTEVNVILVGFGTICEGLPENSSLKALLKVVPRGVCNYQEEVRVKFDLKYSYFDRLHIAIDLLAENVIKKIVPQTKNDFLNPSVPAKASGVMELPRKYDKVIGLDGPQMHALQIALCCEPNKAPVIIIGSFGTGKTRLLAHLAFQILEKNRSARILIVAHHQASADTFINSYFGKLDWEANVCRLIAPNHKKNPRYLKFYSTADEIEQSGWFPQVIVTTLSTSLHLQEYVRETKQYFSHILMDEGAQTREPESVAPLCMAQCDTKIIIAGDHKQVGPSMLVLGEEPRKFGLSLSLLERLHQTYNSSHLFENAVKCHSATLLKNYRCHRALLSLPSYLFYDSALISKAQSNAQLHPKAGFPFHFICSSLESIKCEVQGTRYENEATILLNEVLKYVSKWPKEWGRKDLTSICLMTATADQKRWLERKVWEEEKLKKVRVLTAYDMQGREFQALFLSVSEPTNADGSTKNPTKSPCDPFVFNTALTRSKSLVVCVGNPFLLLKTEQLLGSSTPCWKDFIRRCVESQTFHVDESLPYTPAERLNLLQKLQKMLFAKDGMNIGGQVGTNDCDSIIADYRKAFEKFGSCKGCKVSLKSEAGTTVWKVVDDTTASQSSGVASRRLPKKVVKCELVIMSHRTAIAYPMDSSKCKAEIIINGLLNRQGAFDGDIVDVEIYPSCECFGRVVKVEQKSHWTKYVCKVDRHSAIHFIPIDGKTPHFVNLPKLSRGLVDRFSRDLIDSGLEMQKESIVVFDEESLTTSDDNVNLPLIKEVISMDKASNLLFVVVMIGWDPTQYRLPLGAVVEALPKGSSFFYAERLLSVSCDVTNKEVNCTDQMIPNTQRDTKLRLCNQAFTIDPPEAVNLDDALSLVSNPHKEGHYRMEVFITNVAKHISKGSKIDKLAQRKGSSVYGSKEEKTLMQMIPSEVASQLSLLPGKVRDAICVSASVHMAGNRIITVLPDHCPEEVQVQSQLQLSYSNAQAIMNGVPVDANNQNEVMVRGESLSRILQLLYKIAMHLRMERIGNAAYCHDPVEPGEEDCWQMHELVSELMIWANKRVATFVHGKLPSQTLLRRQPAPTSCQFESFLGQHSHILGHSLAFQHSNPPNHRTPLVPLKMILPLLEDINACVQNNDLNKVQLLLSNTALYPQLAVAKLQLTQIACRAEYVCTSSRHHHSVNMEDDLNGPFWHDHLRLKHYTHFTSPLRRYSDIVVERLLVSIIKRSQVEYTPEDIANISKHLNVRFRASKEYQLSMINLELAMNCGKSCKRDIAFLVRQEGNKAEFCFPYLQVQSKGTKFHLSLLTCTSSASEGVNQTLFSWNATMTSFKKEDHFLSHPKVASIIENEPRSSTDRVIVTVYCNPDPSSASPPNRANMAHSLEVNKLFMITHPEFVKIPSVNWQKVQKSVNCDAKMDDVCKLLGKPKGSGGIARSIQTKLKNSPVMRYDVSRTLNSSDVITVWVGKSLKEPIFTPCIQLVEVAPELKICLEHNRNPAACFSDIDLQLASKATYISGKEYITLWEKVMLAEAATASVQKRSLAFIKDVELIWEKLSIPDTCFDEVYYVPAQVRMVVPMEHLNSLEYMSVSVGDLVCARYEIMFETKPPLRAVYHFVITKAPNKDKLSKLMKEQGIGKQHSKMSEEEKMNTCTFIMKCIGKTSCQVSEEMEVELNSTNPPCCELQLIRLEESMSRVYRRLLGLSKESKHEMDERSHSKLSLQVALGTTIYRELPGYNSQILKREHVWDIWESDGGKQLNRFQRDAIRISFNREFSMIQGPPGTGKSETSAHLAYLFALQNHDENKTVLYCGPSNKAVDVVHEKLLSLKEKGVDFKIIRVYSRTHEQISTYRYKTWSRFGQDGDSAEGKCSEKFKPDSLHYKIRAENKEIQTMEELFESMDSENRIPTPNLLAQQRNLITETEENVLSRKYDVILCTCNESCSSRLLRASRKVTIAQCIVDECGMAHEPETIAAISLSEHVVLIGDHKQLKPVIHYIPARENGLSTSLFQRYVEKTGLTPLRLRIQYRMHREICEFPSRQFYNSLLKADESLKARIVPGEFMDRFWPRGKDCPIVLCNVVGEEEETKDYKNMEGARVDSHSKHNLTEAEKALKVVEVLHDHHSVQYEEMAIITPYKAQKELIRNKMKKSGRRFSKSQPSVVTIMESQGDEYGYVIFTTVRSQPEDVIRYPHLVQPDHSWRREYLGFITDTHQINVGITRAKYGLIIIGNRMLLEYDQTWKALIEHYEKRKCIVDGRNFPPIFKRK